MSSIIIFYSISAAFLLVFGLYLLYNGWEDFAARMVGFIYSTGGLAILIIIWWIHAH